jgi:hypothetical protein
MARPPQLTYLLSVLRLKLQKGKMVLFSLSLQAGLLPRLFRRIVLGAIATAYLALAIIKDSFWNKQPDVHHILSRYSPRVHSASMCSSCRARGHVKQKCYSYEPKSNSYENFQRIPFITTNQPSPWSNIFLQKLTVAQLLTKFTEVHRRLYKIPPSPKSYVTLRNTVALSLLALHSNPTPEDHSLSEVRDCSINS